MPTLLFLQRALLETHITEALEVIRQLFFTTLQTQEQKLAWRRPGLCLLVSMTTPSTIMHQPKELLEHMMPLFPSLLTQEH